MVSISPSFHLELYCPSFVLRKLNKVIFVCCSHNLPLISSGIVLSVRHFISNIASMAECHLLISEIGEILLVLDQESGDAITMERCRVVMRNVLQ